MSAPLRYPDWLKRLERQGLEGAYLFAGPETLLRDQAVALLRERLGPGHEIERYWGSECTLGAVAAGLGSTGLFASAKLVTLGELERTARMAQAERDALSARLAAPHPGTVFVGFSEMTTRELIRRGDWMQKLADRCVTVELWHPRPEEAMRWLLEESRRRSLKLAPAAGQRLLEAIGPDLQELSRELEKLELLTEAGALIDEETLSRLIRTGRSGTVWELCDAWIDGRLGEGFKLWDQLSESEAVLRVQWLLQQKSRERAGRGDGGAAQMALRAYDLERGIKTGRIASGSDHLALDLMILGTHLQRGTLKRPAPKVHGG
ncbi:MAG: hypothetical protein IT349_03865 [Candidatus Eisenbacteria bacterium]|nr:hypothetical protein [Candidatus Eisenbacteria bacterium]MCC7141219.1 hypothetical protein [Candidatus Eisenbacteria bacterium]